MVGLWVCSALYLFRAAWASGKTPHDNLLVGVLSRREYDRAAIRNTWGRGHDNVVFVLGACCRVHPSQRIPWTCRKKRDAERIARYEHEQAAVCAEQDESISAEAEKHGDIVFMAETDVYRHLPQKVKRFYSWGLENTEATWFLKADSDFYVRLDSLMVYLAKGGAPSGPTVFGFITDGWGVPRKGKWAEKTYRKRKYPKFPLGSAGHIVDRTVALFVSNNSASLFDYQGEDVSMGIWLDESPFSKAVRWVNSKHMVNSGNCFDRTKFVVGHDVSDEKKRWCYKSDRSKAQLHQREQRWVKVNMVGRLGNNLFQLASGIGISEANQMSLCVPESDRKRELRAVLASQLPPACPAGVKFARRVEKGYARHEVFNLNSDTEIGVYLQSWKYFRLVSIKRMIRFKPRFHKEAELLFPGIGTNADHIVGIHVRRGDQVTIYNYLRFPEDNYFETVLNEFKASKFIVVSDDIAWCKTYPVFEKYKSRITFQEKRVNPVVDLILLTMCDVVVMTMGSFGWWGAFLSHAQVIFNPSEFVMDHKVNKGNVIKHDYYLPNWKSRAVWNSHVNLSKDCANPGPLPAGFDGTAPAVGGQHNHGSMKKEDLHRVQVCQYHSLDVFRRLASRLDFRWTLGAGSLIGGHCYASMNPWDDDIDVSVSRDGASKIRRMWDKLDPAPQYRHDANWDQRFVFNRTFLLYRHLPSANNWLFFKLKPVVQKDELPHLRDLSGLDIFYNSPFENPFLKKSGISEYIETPMPLEDVVFGPTRALQVPKLLVRTYLQHRNWKCL